MSVPSPRHGGVPSDVQGGDQKITCDLVACVRRQVACGTEEDGPGTRGGRGGRGGHVGGEIGSATSGPEVEAWGYPPYTEKRQEDLLEVRRGELPVRHGHNRPEA